jgi:hypothetical protein
MQVGVADLIAVVIVARIFRDDTQVGLAWERG